MLFLACLVMPGLAYGADFYASPGGSGSTCSQASPCSFNTCMNNAGGGDRCRLLNGTYPGQFTTQSGGSSGNPLIIEAVNRHQAILQWNTGDTNDQVLDVRHNNLIIRKLRLDCEDNDGSGNSWDCLRVLGGSNVIIEDIWAHDSGHALLTLVGDPDNVIVRHSTFEEAGLNDDSGEGIYLGGSGATSSGVNDITITRNIFRRFSNNAVDYKNNARNVDLHHNIFEHQKTNPISGSDGDGNIRAQGDNDSQGNFFRSNIMRHGVVGSYYVRLSGNSSDSNRVDVTDNVFYDMEPGPFIGNSTHPPAIIDDNVHCNAATSLGKDIGTGSNNLFNQSQSVCDSKEQEILSAPSPVSCDLTNNVGTVVWSSDFLPISKATNSDFNFECDGSPLTENTTVPFGADRTTTTLSTDPTCTTVTLDLSAGAVENSAFFGGFVADNVSNDEDGEGVNGESVATTGSIVCSQDGEGGGGEQDSEPPYRIAAGGGGSFTDGNENIWVFDREFSAGQFGYSQVSGTFSETSSAISGTTDDGLYQHYRYGEFSYHFTVPNGNYDVTVHMMEKNDSPQTFTVSSEGQAVPALTDYSIVADVGLLAAAQKTFTATVSDGQLDLAFVPSVGIAKVSAIHVREAGTGPAIEEVFQVTDDAYICENPATCGFGQPPVAVVRHTPGNEFRTLLKFNLANISFTSIESATLTINVPGQKGSLAVKAYSTDDDNWDEDTADWDNENANLGSQVDSTAIAQVGEHTFDVTSLVATEVIGDKIVSIVLLDDGPDVEGDGIFLDTKDSRFGGATLTVVEDITP